MATSCEFCLGSGFTSKNYYKEQHEALIDLLKWLDSEVVQQSLKQAAMLCKTHPHLGVPVPEEFSKWAGSVIARARKAVE